MHLKNPWLHARMNDDGNGELLIIVGIMSFEILVGRDTLSIGETFGEICRPLRQIGRIFGILVQK